MHLAASASDMAAMRMWWSMADITRFLNTEPSSRLQQKPNTSNLDLSSSSNSSTVSNETACKQKSEDRKPKRNLRPPGNGNGLPLVRVGTRMFTFSCTKRMAVASCMPGSSLAESMARGEVHLSSSPLSTPLTSV